MELLSTVPQRIIDDLGLRKLGPTATEDLLEIVKIEKMRLRAPQRSFFRPSTTKEKRLTKIIKNETCPKHGP